MAPGLRRLGLRGLAWLIEARGLANRSEGLSWPGPVDKSEGFGRAGRAQGPVDKSEGLGAGLARALSIRLGEVKTCCHIEPDGDDRGVLLESGHVAENTCTKLRLSHQRKAKALSRYKRSTL